MWQILQVQNVDGLCWNLMRQIGGGDLSQKNLWLADAMMDIFTENRFLSMLRIRDEHPGSYFRELRNNFLGLNTQSL
jgi:hypothetical protein